MAKRTVEERFWAKVRKTETCWLWTATTGAYGYGRFFVRMLTPGWRGRTHVVQAHRYAYELLAGPIPEGLTLDHLCRVKRCVKAVADEHGPAHLEPVTPRENTRRHFSRQTHCKRGHPLSGKNLMISSGGWRNCRACQRLYAKARWQATLAARRATGELREL